MKEKEITEFKLKLASLTVELEKEHLHWEALLQYGCQDPFWSDGVNMYLTRNHIIYKRKMIEGICEAIHEQLPEAWYIPVPPEVDINYMANLKPKDPDQKRRLKRLVSMGGKLTGRKPRLDRTGQLSFI